MGSSIILTNRLVNDTISNQWREHEPACGDHQKEQTSGPREHGVDVGGPSQGGLSGDLSGHAEAVKNEERGDFPGGRGTGEVIKDELVHKAGHNERSYHTHQLGPPTPKNAGSYHTGGIVYGRP